MSLVFPRHPANTGFVWHDAVARGGSLSAEQLRSYNRDGYFVLDNAFDTAQMAELIAAIDPLDAETEAYLASRKNGESGISRAGEITFHAHLVERSAVLREFSAHPVLVAVLRDLIGAGARLYWDQSVYKKAGTEREFPWHQDNGYTFVSPQQYVTCWIALTEASEANGCPWVVPGVHTQGTLLHQLTADGFACLSAGDAQTLDAQPVPLAAGSVAVFSSLTPHRTGPNRSTETRKAYILQYAPEGAQAYPRLAPPKPGVPDQGPLGEPIKCDDPRRQYPVLSG